MSENAQNRIKENVNAVITRKVVKGQTRVIEKVPVVDTKNPTTVGVPKKEEE